MEYVRKHFDTTRRLPGRWDLGAYRYKFNMTAFKPFLAALKEKRLLALKCRSCNTVYFPPRQFCGKCLVRADKWVPVRDTGVVATFTATYSKDEKTGEMVPYPVIAVRMDGTDTLYVIEMADVPFDEMYVGKPVRIRWREERTGSVNDMECAEPIEDPTEKMPLFEEEENEGE